MKKSEFKALIAKNFKRSFEVNSPEWIRSLDKKDLKDYINEHGWFAKGKIRVLAIDKAPKIEWVPEDAIYIEAELSDDSENMNWYVIEVDSWSKWLQNYFSDFGGFVLFQHIMSNPIWKTLKIEPREENGRKFLWASAYVRDEYTDKKLSRWLVSDISTWHIPLLIVYRNRATNEELSYEDFRIMIDTMVEDLINEWKTFTEIWTAIEDKMAEYQERHRESQLIEWSTVTIWSNKQAEIKTIKNKFEVIKNEINEDDANSVIEDDTIEAVEDDIVQPEKLNALPDNKETEEINPITEENQTTEENLENEGGIPEGSTDIPEDTPEIVEVDQEKEDLKNKVLELETKVQELETIAKHNASRRVIIDHNEQSNSTTKSVDEIGHNVRKLLNWKSI